VKYDLNIARTDNEVDMRYMINMEYAADLPINTMGRRIRTRLYFTSESHLHTVLNVLRFGLPCGNDDIDIDILNKQPLLSERGMNVLNDTPELCYLTHIVLRVFEDSRSEMANDSNRFRVEILFSPGAHHTPLHMNELDRDHDASRFDTAPLQVIGREGLTCEEVEEFFEKVIAEGSIE
jgi:inositol-hexakisphosphate/diphosphoinositol-pentakisphosphate 1-kinase